MSDFRHILTAFGKPLLTVLILSGFIWLLYIFIIFPLLFPKTKIVHVIDADSLIVLDNGILHKVQLIGVDAPEVMQDGNSQCYAMEAKNVVVNHYLYGSSHITLQADDSLGDKDVHGRLLRYVTLENGMILNELLLKDGLAKEFHLPETVYKKYKDFKTLEEEARRIDAGVWSIEGCRGQF